MKLKGHVQDGVIVLDGDVSLPEGAAVTVTPHAGPVIRVAKHQKRVEFPLVPSTTPGTVPVTNEQIGEILDAEEVEAMKRSWDVPS